MGHQAADPEAGKPNLLRERLVLAIGILASVAILAYLILNHLAALLRVGERIDWRFAAAAVASAAGSYVMVGMVLREVLAMLGYRLPFAEVLGIALVGNTANYFLSSAGLSGFALKAHLLRKRHVPYATTVSAAVVGSVILYLVLAVILGEGLAYLILHLEGTRIAIMEGAFGLAVLLGTAAGLLVFLIHRGFRGRLTRHLFHLLNGAAYMFSQREIPREEFEDFEAQVSLGLERLRGSRRGLVKTIVFTCFDWGLALLTLYFGFKAVGVSLSVGHLSAGFAVGQGATLIPILPGGLGAVEGSMAAVFESLGIGWEEALVAVLLYRIAYFALPGMVSVFVLWGLKISEPGRLDGGWRKT